MSHIYIECRMGCTEESLLAALIGVMKDKGTFMDKLNQVGLLDTRMVLEEIHACGIQCYNVKARVRGEHRYLPEQKRPMFMPNRTQLLGYDVTNKEKPKGEDHLLGNGNMLEDERTRPVYTTDLYLKNQEEKVKNCYQATYRSIKKMIYKLRVCEKVKNDILGIYKLYTSSKAYVSGEKMEEVSLGFAGSLEMLSYVVGICVAMEELNYPSVMVSSIHVGCGTVTSEEGILPIPTPTTAHLLCGIPTYSTGVCKELCTALAASVLKYYATNFGEMSVMETKCIGYGVDDEKNLSPSILRVYLCEEPIQMQEQLIRLSCNIDDMTGDELSYLVEQLVEYKATEVYLVPIVTKKNRPGYTLICICEKEKQGYFLEQIYLNTTCMEVQCEEVERNTLVRQVQEFASPYGMVRVNELKGTKNKQATLEYEDIRKIAKESGISYIKIKKDLYHTLKKQVEESE